MSAFTKPNSGHIANAILDAFPSGSYALTGLLRLLDIVETDKVPTAAVECKIEPRLLINPLFVSQHANTSEKLLSLVLHELHHVLLGHTTLFPRATKLQNFVFDAVINGIVCRIFPQQEHTSFFTDYYRSDQFPECLLRPPPGWPTHTDQYAPALDHLPEAHRERVKEIHQALYSEAGASYHEVYETLPKVINEAGGCVETSEGIDNIPLLGDHGSTVPNSDQIRDKSPVLFEIIREIVEQWPKTPDPLEGKSLSDVLSTSLVNPKRVASNRAILKSLIRKIAGSKHSGTLKNICDDPLIINTPIPANSRRTAILNALGVRPLLHSQSINRKRLKDSSDKVHIYIDVSGSMNSILKPLYGAVIDCKSWVFPTIHLFSTKVADISLGEIRSGKCLSTGGTDITCVANHIAQHRVKRALLITDGWVGRPQGQHQDVLTKTKLAVAYLGLSTNKHDLIDVANFTDQLNESSSK